MPTFLFNDQFVGYPLGNGIPTGFAANGGVDSEFQEPASPTPAPGYYEKSGVIYKLNGEIEFPPSNALSVPTTALTTVWWTTIGIPNAASGGFAIGQMRLASTDPTGTLPSAGLLSVVLEADGSLSVEVNGATKANTLQQVIFPYTWQIIQLDAAFGITVILGTSYVSITFSLSVNGLVFLSGVNKVSGTPVNTLWDNASGINQWFYNVPGGFGTNTYFSEIAATATNEPIPSYPNGASPNSLVSQIAVEVIKLPPTTDARVSQLIVELAKVPPRNARVSQIIVEIIKRKRVASGGWLTYEA